MNQLHELKYDTTRQIVTTTRGEIIHVKEHRGWKYINYDGKKIGVSSLALKQENDCVFDYIFEGGFKNFPCPAMDYWIYRHRLGNRISVANYKKKFHVKIKN